MRFKRPQVRYADTPQPATPYQSAAQVWDDRIGSARVQAKNWRFMAFGCLTLALLMAGGLVWRSAQSIVTPYVIEVDQSGQVRAVGEAATPYRPADAQIAHHLARFVTLVRSLSIDPIVVRQNWLDAYDYTTDKGAAVPYRPAGDAVGRPARNRHYRPPGRASAAPVRSQDGAAGAGSRRKREGGAHAPALGQGRIRARRLSQARGPIEPGQSLRHRPAPGPAGRLNGQNRVASCARSA